MNQNKITAMTEGGRRLAQVLLEVKAALKPGVTLLSLDTIVDQAILKLGDTASFKTVKGYHHATCINLNDGIVHGLPNSTLIKPGDLVSVDAGILHDGFHVDASFSLQVPPMNKKNTQFLQAGEAALKAAIQEAKIGNSVFDISLAMEKTLRQAGYTPVRDLTGHGVGRELHETPAIPCYADPRNKRDLLKEGQTIAIEAMYCMGDYHLVQDPDGWTIRTRDHSLTGLFEDTVLITKAGPKVLTTI